MYRHHDDTIGAALPVVYVGHQGGLLQKVLQCFFRLLVEIVQGGFQLLYIGNAVITFRSLPAEFFDQIEFVKQLLQQLTGWCIEQHALQCFQQQVKILQPVTHRDPQLVQHLLNLNHCAEGKLPLPGFRFQQFHRLRADTAAGIIDNTAQGDIVLGIDEQLQVSQQILDLAAFIKLDATHDGVRNIIGPHHIFQGSRLCIGAIENGHFPQRYTLPLAAPDLIVDTTPLVELVPGDGDDDLFAAVVCGPELLGVTVRVLFDHCLGRLEDVAAGTVILLQFEYPATGIIPLKLQDVADIGATPAVDGLVVIPDHADVVITIGQLMDNLILHPVGVLVFVDQDVAKSLLVKLQPLRCNLEQLQRLDQQIIKIERVILFELLLVMGIDFMDLLVQVAGVQFGKFVRILVVVLGVGDPFAHQLRFQLFEIVTQLQHDRLDQPELIVGVIDDKVTVIAKQLDLTTQNLGEYGMESADPEVCGGGTDQLVYPLFHLSGRFIGEGQGENLPGIAGATFQQPRDTPGEHPRFAAAGAGQYQQWSVSGLYRRSLWFIQMRQIHHCPCPRRRRRRSRVSRARVCSAAVRLKRCLPLPSATKKKYSLEEGRIAAARACSPGLLTGPGGKPR